jgi:AraC-like DNA-binding protein
MQHKPYQTVQVPPALRPFVLEIRVDESPGAETESRPYTVLPGPFPVLGFRLAGELRVLRNREAELLSSCGITGLQEGPLQYRATARTRSALVTLRPEGAFRLFGVNMDELVNQEAALDRLLPMAAVRSATDRIAEAGDAEVVGEVIGLLLEAAYARSRAPTHAAVTAAVTHILSRRGNLRVEQLAREVAIGRRQLERLFRLHVGVSPKRLSQITRFSWAAAQLESGRPWGQLALSAGYADQAHFVRAFTEFAGAPPTRLLASGEAREMSHSFNT